LENLPGSFALNNCMSSKRVIKQMLLGFVVLCCAFGYSISSAKSSLSSTELEVMTESVLLNILNANWSDAHATAEQLVAEFPDYALGHLLLAETFNQSAMQAPLFNQVKDYSPELIALLLEARDRAHQSMTNSSLEQQNKTYIPDMLVQVGAHINHVLVIDVESSELFLYDTTGALPKLVRQHYISSGKGGFGKLSEGDLKTPLGVYNIIGRRSDESLPDLYGSGALILDYPNTLDRSLGRTGSGIWLHGIPTADRSRSPRSSEGCVTMANDLLFHLYEQLNLNNTHVVLSDNFNWSSEQENQYARERFQLLFNRYIDAWRSANISALNALYTPDSVPATVRYNNPAVAKRVSINNQSPYQHLAPAGLNLTDLASVSSESISIIKNPDVHDATGLEHLVMSFDIQGKNPARVTLYWSKTASSDWQIKREVVEASGA
jgi:hypothetical protein